MIIVDVIFFGINVKISASQVVHNKGSIFWSLIFSVRLKFLFSFNRSRWIPAAQLCWTKTTERCYSDYSGIISPFSTTHIHRAQFLEKRTTIHISAGIVIFVFMEIY